MTIWEVPISGLLIEGASGEPCEITVGWEVIGDHYADPQSSGGSLPKIEVVEICEAWGLESGNDYTQDAKQTFGLKEHLEQIIVERLEV